MENQECPVCHNPALFTVDGAYNRPCGLCTPENDHTTIKTTDTTPHVNTAFLIPLV
jgi:hypothetical protein